MAYVIGKKVVKDTTEFNDYAYGLTIPVQKGENGYFRQGFTSFEQARANLINLLLTQRGERVMQPNFGTGLHSLLFEQATDDLEERIQLTIEESVNFWLPYINISEIEITMSDEMKDNNRADISVSFTVGNSIDTQEITFTIEG
jgi:phage baseplate assembly protein W